MGGMSAFLHAFSFCCSNDELALQDVVPRNGLVMSKIHFNGSYSITAAAKRLTCILRCLVFSYGAT